MPYTADTADSVSAEPTLTDLTEETVTEDDDEDEETFSITPTAESAALIDAFPDESQRDFRLPTREEVADVWEALAKISEPETADMAVTNSYMIVVPHYQTDCPGYCGEVMLLLHRGSPDCVETFVRYNGECMNSKDL